MPDARASYEKLIESLRNLAVLGSISAVVSWDERVCMPAAGAELRAEQSALLAGMLHERFTAPEIGQWLAEVEQSDLMGDPHGDIAVNVRHTRRRYDRQTKVPPALVKEFAAVAVRSQAAWAKAKQEDDYPSFQPWLQKVVELSRQQAACFGGDPYDALLDDYEPGETAENLRRIFREMRGPLVELIRRIVAAGKAPRTDFVHRNFPIPRQEALGRSAAQAIGFDFAGGRLDVSVHPFSTSIGPGDTRITTRYSQTDIARALFGVLHETGHALYSQGLPAEHFGTPRGGYVSLGIHESQSLMWEAMVGRSRAFWKWFFPKTREAFASQLTDVSPQEWYFAINEIRPSFIRTESDDATYNLHVLLRFELEQDLLSGALHTRDLPTAWNQRMQDYLGITPPNDRLWCLQDIHWSTGSIGYFPTYSLGKMYAAQFFEQANQDLGDLPRQFERGEFGQLLAWLREKIHAQGMKYSASELVERITGRRLSPEPLLNHLRRKAHELYGVNQ